ncbi:hypothetical protein ACS2BX_26010 [Bacillus cereus group sp. BceL300]|uniref:hypothetical protein n=1 Tax=Bacillus cereus group TaxID=86661 RepID=UPI001443D005|nr:hypothetical protein [Bacillus cereus]MDK7480928.1 hypothetical protein [Bacillus cereus]NKW77439.1 hypothetical protein [Bacillus cereus]NKX14857.1 hypothetical protein [Bacillus cereus]HDR8003417.1 hypothetical protein [Bacillus cereus]HDR8014964.1 hypothetical protein [Bacillus cereus]
MKLFEYKKTKDGETNIVIGGIATIVLSVFIGIAVMNHPEYLVDTVVHLKGLLK